MISLSDIGEAIGSGLSHLGEAALNVSQFMGLAPPDAALKIIPGNPDKLRELSGQLTTLAGGFERAGQGFKTINTGGWYGEAADGFHQYLDTAAPKWFDAADAFVAAGKALGDYADTLAEAQHRAKQAVENLQSAQARSEAAAEQHNAKVDAYNTWLVNGGGPPPPVPGTFVDPAAEDKAAAQDALKHAISMVGETGNTATRAILQAAEAAPKEPGQLTKISDVFADGMQIAGDALLNIGQGLGSALGGTYQFLRTINPLDTYNLGHMGEYAANMQTMGAGIVNAVQFAWNNPGAALQKVIQVDGWVNKPFQTFGSFLPSLVPGGGVAGKLGATASRVARTGSKLADGNDHDAPTGRPSSTANHSDQPSPPPQSPGTPNSDSNFGQTWGNIFDFSDAPSPPGGNSDVPPSPQPEAPTSGTRPDGGFGPQGSQPDVTDEPPQNYRTSPVERTHPWESDPSLDIDEQVNPGPHHDETQPWRPSSDPSPSANGETGFSEPPAHSGPAGPEARPEVHDMAGPEPDSHGPAASGHDAGLGGPAVENGPPGQSPGLAGADYSGNSDFRASEDDLAEYREKLGPEELQVAQDIRDGNPALADMSPEEVAAVRRYLGPEYVEINDALRAGNEVTLERLDNDIKAMTSGMNKLPDWAATDQQPVVFRGIDIPSDRELADMLTRYEPGSPITEDSFVSGDRGRPYAGNVEFVIEPGHAKDVGMVKSTPDGEVGWPPGNNFTVTERLYNENTEKWQIFMQDHGR